MLWFLATLILLGISDGRDNVKSYNNKGPMKGKVVNGVSTHISRYPFVAQINNFGYCTCGGVIITKRVILTVAHCIYANPVVPHLTKYLKILVGSHTCNNGQVHRICRTYIHKKYFDLDYPYDIGLILLQKDIQFSTYIQPAKLATNYKFKKKRHIIEVLGFGKTNEQNPFGSPDLLMTIMQYVDHKSCENTPPYEAMPVPNHMFCLLGKNYNSDCSGDSGNGVVWNQTVIGLSTLGRELGCGSSEIPSMYTDVIYFRNWIKTSIKELEVEACTKELKEENQVIQLIGIDLDQKKSGV